MHTVKPIDRRAVIAAARETGAIVTAEEHLAAGGMGTQVARVVAESYPVPVKMVAMEDTYAQSGKPEELLEEYGLTAEHIVAAAKEARSLKR